MSYQPIDHLNRPPHPFWNFVADMDAAYRAPGTQQPAAAESGPSANANASSNANEQTQQQQPNVEDPPEVDPATIQGERDPRQEQWRGRRRRGSNSDEEHDRRRGCGRRGGRRGWGGPPGAPGPFGPGFPFGGFGGLRWGPDMSRGPPPPPQGDDFPHPHGSGPFGPRGPGRHRGGPFHPHHGPHRHPHGPHGHGPRSRSPPPPRSEHNGFDLHKFLNDLGERIGIDLASAAANLGLTNPTPDQQDVDFEPKADIFDEPTQYTVHLSLPGAKKSDIGVDWDGEHSTLRIGGVVYRPDITEEMLSHLIVDGRKRETGVFEKLIRLGTRREPAVVNVDGISARMRDGVLVVVVSKGEKRHERREVPIAKSATPSPARHEELMVFDAAGDHQMTDSDQEGNIQLVDRTMPHVEEKGKQVEYENEKRDIQSRESSATVEAEPEPEPVREQLPAYHPVDQHDVDDWEKFESGDEGEGEYVKINVD